MRIYGDQNNDKLPTCDADGKWLWDVPRPATDAIVEAGARAPNFYCPGMTASVNERALYGDPTNPNTAEGWWNYGGTAGKRRIIGYGFLIRRTGATGDQMPGYLTPGGAEFVSRMTTTNPAIKEVTFCPTLSVGLNDFVNVPSTTSRDGRHRSAHMGKGVPDGGDILFMDNHASWRKYRGNKSLTYVPGRDYLIMMYDMQDRDVRWWF
jgi:hypothetical protein